MNTSGETPAPADPPKVQTAPRPGSLQPSVFDDAQIVSFYGYPGIGVMGELGLHSASGAAAAIARVAAEYDALNGPREVMPALHLIVAVAQRDPGRSGLYLSRMGDDRLEEYIEAARETGILLFLDLQIGWSDALTETRLLEDALREPFVHLALDPEFATRGRGTAPGVAIGSLGADDVNAVQEYLAELVRTDGLPPKVLVLHQFLQSMLTDVDRYDGRARGRRDHRYGRVGLTPRQADQVPTLRRLRLRGVRRDQALLSLGRAADDAGAAAGAR